MVLGGRLLYDYLRLSSEAVLPYHTNDKSPAFDRSLSKINTELNTPVPALVLHPSMVFLIDCLYLFSLLPMYGWSSEIISKY